jgi:CHAT domain-containing protein
MTLYGMARVEDKQGNLEGARQHISSALQIIESLRTSVTSEELRTSYFASVQDYYEFYIDLLMRLGQQNKRTDYEAAALQVSERARARNLLDILTEAHADIRHGVDPALLDKESQLRKELNAKLDYHLRLQSVPTPSVEQLAVLNTEIEDLQKRFDDVERFIRKASPRLAALKHPEPLSLNEIQSNLLDRQTVLLEYAIGADWCYLWIVTSESLQSIALPTSPQVIHATADRFIRMLKESGGTERNLEIVATKLSGMLMPPEVVSSIGSKQRVLVVADGILQGLPFGALSLASATEPYRPLVATHEVVSLPSASTLATIRSEFRGRRLATRSIVVLADPVFSERDERLTRQRPIRKRDKAGGESKVSEVVTQSQTELAEKLISGNDQTRSGIRLERLRGTRREAIRIQRLVPGARIALDFGASLNTALSPDLRHYRIVHFATHGIAPDSHPELSGVVLSLFNRHGQSQEGYLGLPLVYNLELPVELVVLSACETGLGETIRGEGLIGLTRGFMYAGSPRVVASYWKVREGATEELMKRFYVGIFQRKLRPAAALSAAQASMWKEQRWSMSDWAGFAFFGEPR